MRYKKVYPTEILQGFTMNAMYIMMLYEPLSNKKIPVMIGEHEAQMILLEQGSDQSRRPMTHQLIVSIMDEFALTLKLVRINRFEEGIFYASLVVSDGFSDHEIDARASDAVMLALHQCVDIEMAEEVIDDTGFTPRDESIDLSNNNVTIPTPEEQMELLEEELRQCEENEDYERAAEIVKKIEQLKGNE